MTSSLALLSGKKARGHGGCEVCWEEGKLAKSMWVVCGSGESGKEPVAGKEGRTERSPEAEPVPGCRNL